MGLIIPFSLSCLTGYLVLLTLFREKPVFNKTLTLILSAGLGIGLNSILTFYSFFLMNGFSRTAVWTFALVLPAVLALINIKIIFNRIKNFPVKISPLSPLAWLVWGLLLYVVIFMARMHPYGEWDAWALYNMKMKFLLLSAERWKDIFEKLHWYTQPDYPLLLPFINVYNFALGQAAQPVVPLVTGVVFAMLIIWLMFGGLKQIMPPPAAFFASLLLLANPFYIFQSTAQYADTILAFYLLASVLCMNLALLYSDKRMAGLCGLMLGLMTFTKNEGIVMAILLIAVFTLYLSFKSVPQGGRKKSLLLVPCLLAGFALTGSATCILKLFLAPHNKDIFGGLSAGPMKFMNRDGLMIIVNAFAHETSHKRWAFIWHFIGLLLVLANKRLFFKECKTFLFFMLLYSAVLTVIYLTTVNFELSWRLDSTLHRICYYLLPSLLFSAYYAIYRGRKNKEVPA